MLKRALVAMTLLALPAFAAQAGTLDTVKKRGKVICGFTQGVPGFSYADGQGKWKGFDVDLCRGIAAAIFDDPEAFQGIPTSAKERFTVLQSGEIDVPIRQTTWTLSREASMGLVFVGINYLDGQGFLVKKKSGVTTAKQLGGASVCTTTGTTTELNLADFGRTNGMKLEVVGYTSIGEAVSSYDSGRCDVLSTDRAALAALRTQLSKPDDSELLPETMSQEPLGPVVRQGDDQWLNIVKWTLFAMINAEALGVTQANVEQQRTSATVPDVRRLLGVESKPGEGLGLPDDWALRIIRHVGNYADSFERHLGESSPLKLSRGLNALWNRGGILYAPPVR